MRCIFLRLTLVVGVAGLLLVAAPFVRADGELYQTPPDGAWAEYAGTITATSQSEERMFEGEIRLSSVGQVEEDGQACRWIELVFQGFEEDGSPGPRQVFKMLVPDEHLTGGEDATEHIVRGWTAFGELEPRPFEPGSDVGPLQLFLGSPLEGVERLEPEEIEVEGLGTLTCEHEAGALTVRGPGGDDMTLDAEIWWNAETPFGLVRIHVEGSVPDPDVPEENRFELEFTLVAVGDDAESVLPDAD